jgi:NitT/TauT family transport system ATP-binding protein
LWQETRKTVIFVTHDVDEALTLADRIAVLSPKPTRLIDTIAVAAPRPRLIETDPGLLRIRSRLHDLLHFEMEHEA